MPPTLTSPLVLAIAALGALVLILLFVVAHHRRKIDDLLGQLDDADSRQRSLSTTYGRITEQWFPLLGEYPYDPQEFRFLGSPVDGVQFNEDSVVFVEFKANKSRLSEKQRRIRKLVEEGHVYWEEFHFTDEG